MVAAAALECQARVTDISGGSRASMNGSVSNLSFFSNPRFSLSTYPLRYVTVFPVLTTPTAISPALYY